MKIANAFRRRSLLAKLWVTVWVTVSFIASEFQTPLLAQETTPRTTLGDRQASVALRFQKLQDLLLRLAEIESAENPERAALLRRAARQASDQFILEKLKTASDSLQTEEFQKAVDNQEAATKELASLLTLLMSEDRSERIRAEKDRVQQMVKDLKRTLNNQRSVRARTENGIDLEQLKSEQKAVTERGAAVKEQMQADSGESPTEDSMAQSPNESPSEKDQQDAGQSTERDEHESPSSESKPDGSKEENDQPETSSDESSEASSDASGSEGSQPEKTDPEKKDSDQETNSESDPAATDETSDPSESSQPNSDNQESNQTPSSSGESPPSQSPQNDSSQSESSPSSEQQSSSSPSSQPQTPEQQAQQQLEKAIEKMQQAEKALEDAKREQAAEKQRAAEEDLREAIDELEKILRQLREEEMQRELARLEARLKKMATMQTKVLEDTISLASTPTSQRNRQTDLKAGELAFEEKKITLEADRAMLLLREEGSSVAFPEVVRQIRDDTARVSNLLNETKIDIVSQGIQQDILAALEEMILALQKAQRDLEEQQQQQQPPGSPPPSGQSEQPLVESIAELKLIRTMQLRIQGTTNRYADVIEAGQNTSQEILPMLRELAERQDRLDQITRDIAMERNQ